MSTLKQKSRLTHRFAYSNNAKSELLSLQICHTHHNSGATGNWVHNRKNDITVMIGAISRREPIWAVLYGDIQTRLVDCECLLYPVMARYTYRYRLKIILTNGWAWKHVYDRFPNGSIGDLNAEEEQFMPYPKGIETEPKPIAHWKTAQWCYGMSEKDMYQEPKHK